MMMRMMMRMMIPWRVLGTRRVVVEY